VARLRLLTDEHVPSAAVRALRADGFSVVTARELLGDRTVDPDLLTAAAESDRILLTNDRDFVRLHECVDHTGILVYTSQDLSPDDFVRAALHVERHLGYEVLRGDLHWLEQWLG